MAEAEVGAGVDAEPGSPATLLTALDRAAHAIRQKVAETRPDDILALRDLTIGLPPGLVGNPNATPRCSAHWAPGCAGRRPGCAPTSA